jgi:tripartite-type tricarboxylate transporter receptor subunit TctC
LIAWFALVAPAGTPAPVIRARARDRRQVPRQARRESALRRAGTDVAPMNPEQLGGFIKSEIIKFARLAKEAGIQPE